MLDTIGMPLLRWLGETLIPEARKVIDDFDEYVESWVAFLNEDRND